MSISWQMSNDNRLCGKCPQHTGGVAALDHYWQALLDEWGSCVDAAILPLISMTSSMACSLQTPDVSMATGTKSTPEMISAYFCFFFASAAAAKPACVLLAWMCDIAYVSGQVTSQARHRPLLHGTCVTPSGRLPLLVHSECDSRVASVSALMNARHSRSLIWLCRL